MFVTRCTLVAAAAAVAASVTGRMYELVAHDVWAFTLHYKGRAIMEPIDRLQ